MERSGLGNFDTNPMLMSGCANSANLCRASTPYATNGTNATGVYAINSVVEANDSSTSLFSADIDGADLTFNGVDEWAVWSPTVIPVPAAVWLFGSALGLLGWLRKLQNITQG